MVNQMTFKAQQRRTKGDKGGQKRKKEDKRGQRKTKEDKGGQNKTRKDKSRLMFFCIIHNIFRAVKLIYKR